MRQAETRGETGSEATKSSTAGRGDKRRRGRQSTARPWSRPARRTTRSNPSVHGRIWANEWQTQGCLYAVLRPAATKTGGLNKKAFKGPETSTRATANLYVTPQQRNAFKGPETSSRTTVYLYFTPQKKKCNDASHRGALPTSDLDDENGKGGPRSR